MDEKEMSKIMFDLISPLHKWFGIKRILVALAKIEERRSLVNRATGTYWDAKHNAELLQDTAESMRG